MVRVFISFDNQDASVKYMYVSCYFDKFLSIIDVYFLMAYLIAVYCLNLYFSILIWLVSVLNKSWDIESLMLVLEYESVHLTK